MVLTHMDRDHKARTCAISLRQFKRTNWQYKLKFNAVSTVLTREERGRRIQLLTCQRQLHLVILHTTYGLKLLGRQQARNCPRKRVAPTLLPSPASLPDFADGCARSITEVCTPKSLKRKALSHRRPEMHTKWYLIHDRTVNKARSQNTTRLLFCCVRYHDKLDLARIQAGTQLVKNTHCSPLPQICLLCGWL